MVLSMLYHTFPWLAGESTIVLLFRFFGFFGFKHTSHVYAIRMLLNRIGGEKKQLPHHNRITLSYTWHQHLSLHFLVSCDVLCRDFGVYMNITLWNTMSPHPFAMLIWQCKLYTVSSGACHYSQWQQGSRFATTISVIPVTKCHVYELSYHPLLHSCCSVITFHNVTILFKTTVLYALIGNTGNVMFSYLLWDVPYSYIPTLVSNVYWSGSLFELTEISIYGTVRHGTERYDFIYKILYPPIV